MHDITCVTLFRFTSLIFISCEIFGADLHILSTHGHIFVAFLDHIFVAFLLDTINRFYSTKYGNVLSGFCRVVVCGCAFERDGFVSG